MSRLTEEQKRQLMIEIGRVPQAREMGIAYLSRGGSQVVRPAKLPNGLQTWIVLQEEPNPGAATAPAAGTGPNLRAEVLNLGLSCGSAALAGIAVAGSAAAVPVTAGASAPVTVLAYAGLIATSAQCAVAGGRVLNEIFDPQNNAWLDSQEWYQAAANTLDAVSLVGGMAGLGQASQALIRLSRASGRPIHQLLQGISRPERKALARELAAYTGQAHTRKQFIRLARAGKIPKIFTSAQVQQAVVNQLLDAVSSGLTLAGSATSGVLRQVRVHLMEDE